MDIEALSTFVVGWINLWGNKLEGLVFVRFKRRDDYLVTLENLASQWPKVIG